MVWTLYSLAHALGRCARFLYTIASHSIPSQTQLEDLQTERPPAAANADALQRLNQLARGAWLFCSWSRSSFAGGGVGAVTSCCVGSERCQFFNASAAMPLQLLRARRPAQRSQAGASLPGGPAQRAAHARRGGQHCCSAACGGASRQRTRPCCSDYWNTWSCCSDGQRAGRE